MRRASGDVGLTPDAEDRHTRGAYGTCRMALAPNTAQDTASAEPPGSSQRAGWALGCGLALLLAGLAGWQIIERGHSGTPLVFSLLATTLLFLPYTLFGLTNLPQRLRPRLSRHAAALPLAAAALLVPYLNLRARHRHPVAHQPRHHRGVRDGSYGDRPCYS